MLIQVASARQSGSIVRRFPTFRGARKNGLLAAIVAIGLGVVLASELAAEPRVRRTTIRDSADALGFGAAVAVDGRTLVVGADGHGYNYRSGEVFVFERSDADPDQWTEVARLAPTDVVPPDDFGYAVALSGDTLVAASSGAGGWPNPNPRAWIYQRNGAPTGPWVEIAELLPEGGGFANRGDVAIDGDIAVVGDMGADAVYLFARNAGGLNRWGQIAKLMAAADTADGFGSAVAIDGDTLVVGAFRDNPLGEWEGAGAAYVFQRMGDDPASWVEAARLAAADGQMADHFGSEVDLDGDTIVVGAPTRGWGEAPGYPGGAAYIFERDRGGAGQWGQAAQIFPTISPWGRGDSFGRSVALRGDQLLVGAPFDADMCTENDKFYCETGAAYFFIRNRGGLGAWGLRRKFYASAPWYGGDLRQFGWAVDLDATSGVVGAPGVRRAYVYRRVVP